MTADGRQDAGGPKALLAAVGSTPASLLRVALWTLVGLLVIEALVPVRRGWQPAPEREQPDNLVMPTDFGDPRGFRAELPPRADGQELRVAWIGGSSLNVRLADASQRRQLSAYVADELRVRSDLEPVVLRYTVEAMRVFETYVCLLDALRRDPDVVVITLSPVFLFARSMPVKRTYLAARAATLLPADPGTWLDFAAVSEPSQWARGALAEHLSLVDDQREWSRWYRARLPTLDLSADEPGPTKRWLDAWRAEHTLTEHDDFDRFWQTAIPHIEGREVSDWQPYVLGELVDTSPGSMSHRWLDRILATLVESDVAALVYLAPIGGRALEDPTRAANVAAVEQALAARVERFARPGLTLLPHNLADAVDGLQFLDYVHLRLRSRALPSLLAETLLDTYADWWRHPPR